MQQKKVILMLGRQFPTGHPKQGQPTRFLDSIKEGSKIHTVRRMTTVYNLWEKRMKDINSGQKYLSLREWTGRPYNSYQRELMQFDRIGLQRIHIELSGTPFALIDHRLVPIDILAQNDGMETEDFLAYMSIGLKEPVFDGVVVHFTDYRY